MTRRGNDGFNSMTYDFFEGRHNTTLNIRFYVSAVSQKSKRNKTEKVEIQEGGLFPDIELLPGVNPFQILDLYYFLVGDRDEKSSLWPNPQTLTNQEGEANIFHPDTWYSQDKNRPATHHSTLLQRLSKLLETVHTTNHQLRTHGIEAMGRGGYKDDHIAKVTHHKNLKSLASYRNRNILSNRIQMMGSIAQGFVTGAGGEVEKIDLEKNINLPHFQELVKKKGQNNPTTSTEAIKFAGPIAPFEAPASDTAAISHKSNGQIGLPRGSSVRKVDIVQKDDSVAPQLFYPKLMEEGKMEAPPAGNSFTFHRGHQSRKNLSSIKPTKVNPTFSGPIPKQNSERPFNQKSLSANSNVMKKVQPDKTQCAVLSSSAARNIVKTPSTKACSNITKTPSAKASSNIIKTTSAKASSNIVKTTSAKPLAQQKPLTSSKPLVEQQPRKSSKLSGVDQANPDESPDPHSEETASVGDNSLSVKEDEIVNCSTQAPRPSTKSNRRKNCHSKFSPANYEIYRLEANEESNEELRKVLGCNVLSTLKVSVTHVVLPPTHNLDKVIIPKNITDFKGVDFAVSFAVASGSIVVNDKWIHRMKRNRGNCELREEDKVAVFLEAESNSVMMKSAMSEERLFTGYAFYLLDENKPVPFHTIRLIHAAGGAWRKSYSEVSEAVKTKAKLIIGVCDSEEDYSRDLPDDSAKDRHKIVSSMWILKSILTMTIDFDEENISLTSQNRATKHVLSTHSLPDAKYEKKDEFENSQSSLPNAQKAPEIDLTISDVDLTNPDVDLTTGSDFDEFMKDISDADLVNNLIDLENELKLSINPDLPTEYSGIDDHVGDNSFKQSPQSSQNGNGDSITEHILDVVYDEAVSEEHKTYDEQAAKHMTNDEQAAKHMTNDEQAAKHMTYDEPLRHATYDEQEKHMTNDDNPSSIVSLEAPLTSSPGVSVKSITTTISPRSESTTTTISPISASSTVSPFKSVSSGDSSSKSDSSSSSNIVQTFRYGFLLWDSISSVY